MLRYAAFLRGINLGRRRRINSAELRSLFESIGFSDVATFRTSGNVVFTTTDHMPPDACGLERSLLDSLGYAVTIFLRTASEVRAIAERQPFDCDLVASSKGKLQVILLSAGPPDHVRDDVLAHATAEDRLAFGDRELYWLPSGGTRDAALRTSAIEDLIGPTTMRTKGTIDELAAKFFR